MNKKQTICIIIISFFINNSVLANIGPGISGSDRLLLQQKQLFTKGQSQKAKTAKKNNSLQKKPQLPGKIVHGNEKEQIEKKINKLLKASMVFKKLAKQPHPKGLKKDQIKEAQKYNRWLQKKSRELKLFATRWQSKLSGSNISQQMQEMQMSFNLQYLRLQNKISHENRQFTMVSNIMKNKHDTAKNSINNIR